MVSLNAILIFNVILLTHSSDTNRIRRDYYPSYDIPQPSYNLVPIQIYPVHQDSYSEDYERSASIDDQERCAETDNLDLYRMNTRANHWHPLTPHDGDVRNATARSDKTLDDLSNAKNILRNLEESSQTVAASPNINNGLENLMKNLRMQIEAAERKRKQEARDADAHLHSLIHSHGQFPLEPNYHPGILPHHKIFPIHRPHHLPHPHVLTPGVNLNIQQNQGFHSSVPPHNPLINHGAFPFHHEANFHPTQTIFRSRNDWEKLLEPSDSPNNNFESLSNEDGFMDEEKVGSPTLHLKKKKKYIPIYIRPYYPPSSGYQYYGPRKAEEFSSAPIDKMEQDTNQRNAAEGLESQDTMNKNFLVDDGILRESDLRSPFLFDFPNRRFSEQYKRSAKDVDQILGEHRRIVNLLEENSNNDGDLKLIADIGNRTLAEVENRQKKVIKRSVALSRLIVDPKVKLDVPKTLENLGVATKSAFEDERAPMYHLKHMLGSSKNAVLSAIKISPQNMIIPSDYEIVKSDEITGNSDPNFDGVSPFYDTFSKVGQIVRNSIRSGQETVSHVSDAAHSARNAMHTAKYAVPRFIRPISRIPAVENTRLRKAKKTILLSPRIVDLAQQTLGQKAPSFRPNFVRIGHLLDAVGISNPESKQLELQKLIYEPRKTKGLHVEDSFTKLYDRLREHNDNNIEAMGDALTTLEDAKISTGAQTLREFLIKMRRELSKLIQNSGDSSPRQSSKKERKEMNKFVETLFDGSHKVAPKKEEDVVGDQLFLTPELLHPFMGRPSKMELRQFHKDNGDEDLDKVGNSVAPLDHFVVTPKESGNSSDLGHVLGAMNPLMFERLYGETVTSTSTTPVPQIPTTINERVLETAEDKPVGTFMTMTEPMLKPFMGRFQTAQNENFLDNYNKNDHVDYELVEE